jgi:hypothetical protein
MGERIVRNDEVVGSIPTSSTTFNHLETPKTKTCSVLFHKFKLAGSLPQNFGVNAGEK